MNGEGEAPPPDAVPAVPVVTLGHEGATAAPTAPRDVMAEFKATQEAARTANEAARVAALSPAEQTINTLRKDRAFLDKNDPRHDEVMQKYRAAVEAASTPEERARVEASGLVERREFFNLEPPAMIPKNLHDTYFELYGGHESAFLLAARREGLDAATVRAVRDSVEGAAS